MAFSTREAVCLAKLLRGVPNRNRLEVPSPARGERKPNNDHPAGGRRYSLLAHHLSSRE